MAEPAPEAAQKGATLGAHITAVTVHRTHADDHWKVRLSKCIPSGEKAEDVKIRTI